MRFLTLSRLWPILDAPPEGTVLDGGGASSEDGLAVAITGAGHRENWFAGLQARAWALSLSERPTRPSPRPSSRHSPLYPLPLLLPHMSTWREQRAEKERVEKDREAATAAAKKEKLATLSATTSTTVSTVRLILLIAFLLI